MPKLGNAFDEALRKIIINMENGDKLESELETALVHLIKTGIKLSEDLHCKPVTNLLIMADDILTQGDEA